MIVVRQPEGSVLCGQACVATLAGLTLYEATKAVGHAGRTRAPELVEVLQRLGVVLGPRVRVARSSSPSLNVRGLGSLVTPDRRRGHWVVLDFGAVLDPMRDGSTPLYNYELQAREACGYRFNFFHAVSWVDG